MLHYNSEDDFILPTMQICEGGDSTMTAAPNGGEAVKSSCGKRIVAFILIFILLLSGFAWVFSFHPDHRIYQMIGGFYRQPENTVDVVYIGSSNCYAFWNDVYAWQRYGITVYPYTCGNMPYYATEYIITEVRKTQPNAKFLINVNGVEGEDMGVKTIHNLLDYMPWSKNKVDLLNRLCDINGYSFLDRLEYYFPWLRLRATAVEILKKGVKPKDDGYKGAPTYVAYLSKSVDIAGYYMHSKAEGGLPESYADATERLLDFCDAQNVDVVFVTVPRAEMSINTIKSINQVNAMIRERGYETLELTDETDAIGFDLTQDYYNLEHSNIHGACKFTDYLAKYLIGRFDLKDHRGDPAYASWDEAWEKYTHVIAPFLLQCELDPERRDYELAMPENLDVALNGDTGEVTVRWDGEADGWLVMRKTGKRGVWHTVAELDGDVHVQDDACEPGKTNSYTVVPIRVKDGEKYYGNFLYSGISVKRER